MAKTREEAPILEEREWTKQSRISAARVREILGPAVADRLQQWLKYREHKNVWICSSAMVSWAFFCLSQSVVLSCGWQTYFC
jgi:hypothetical protein